MEETKTETGENKTTIQERFLSDESSKINQLLQKGFKPDKPHPILYFEGVGKYKSIWRRMRKFEASVDGTIYPTRPFNNRKPTRGRVMNEDKKKIHEYLKIARKHVSEPKQV